MLTGRLGRLTVGVSAFEFGNVAATLLIQRTELLALGRDHDRASNLSEYLSLVDRRACWAPGGVALSDGLNGWATADSSGIRWWKDEALADDLDRHHAEWLAIGRPTLGDYRVVFVPIQEDHPPPPTGWALDRPSFRELLWLEEH